MSATPLPPPETVAAAPAVPVGGGGPGLSDERLTELQALRDDVRRKLSAHLAASVSARTTTNFLRIPVLLDEGDELQRAYSDLLAALSAVSAERDAAVSRAFDEEEAGEWQLLKRDGAEARADAATAENDTLREQLRLAVMRADMADAGCAELLAENQALTARATTAEAEAEGLRKALVQAGEVLAKAYDVAGAVYLSDALQSIHDTLQSVQAPLSAPLATAPATGEAGPRLTYPNSVFATEAEHDATVADAVRRIMSGEVQPREPEIDDADGPAYTADEPATPAYEDFIAASDEANLPGYLSRPSFERIPDDRKHQLLADIKSGRFKDKILATLEAEDAERATPGAAPVGGEAGEREPRWGEIWRSKDMPAYRVSIVRVRAGSKRLVDFKPLPQPNKPVMAPLHQRTHVMRTFLARYEPEPVETVGGPLLGSRENGKGGGDAA